MVNVNLFDNETGSFWRGPGMDPTKIKTEVFMLPCASSIEKEGSIANSGRLMQWRYKAVNPVGEALPDGDIMSEIFFKVKELYEKKGGPHKEAITQVNLALRQKGRQAFPLRSPHGGRGNQRLLPGRQEGGKSDQEGRIQGIQKGRSGSHLCLAAG